MDAIAGRSPGGRPLRRRREMAFLPPLVFHGEKWDGTEAVPPLNERFFVGRGFIRPFQSKNHPRSPQSAVQKEAIVSFSRP